MPEFDQAGRGVPGDDPASRGPPPTSAWLDAGTIGPGVSPIRDVFDTDPARLGRVWPVPTGRVPAGMADAAAGSPDSLASWTCWRADELGEVLRHQLAAPLDDAPDAGLSDDTARRGHAGQGGGTFGGLLADPAPLVEMLQRVKRYAKPSMSRDDGDLPREVAGVLYFAAIVAARVRCGRRITGLTDRELRNAAGWALRRPWLTDPLADLFRAGLASLGEPDPGA